MAETASVDLDKDTADAFVNQLSHEARLVLVRAATDRLKDVDPDLLEQLSLEELNIGQLESGQKPRFICPHVGCEQLFDPTTLISIAYHRRVEKPAKVNYGDPQIGDGNIELYREGEDDGYKWNMAAFLCPMCTKPVQLPAKWNWSTY